MNPNSTLKQSDLPRLKLLQELRRRTLGGVVMSELLPHQQPPDPIQTGWLIMAGRGAGKTAAIAKYVTDHVEGPACLEGLHPHRMALIGPTIGDAVESASRHPICLKSLRPEGHLSQRAGGTIFAWPNGAEIKLFGVHTKDDVERLRAGGNNCLVWVEEIAAWRYLQEGWDMMEFGLRVGPHPHWVGSSTPKTRPEFKSLVAASGVTVTNASTYDNPYLTEEFRVRLADRYEGTSMGRQEIYGELIEEAEGASWTVELIEDNRLEEVPELKRVVVAVDPPGGATEAGIVAAGLTVGACLCERSRENLPHVVVLDDLSLQPSGPEAWGSRAVDGFDQWEADRIVGEVNYGGDMVEHVVRGIRENVPFKSVRATRGKARRAEPVVALYEQRRVHHVGVFPALESELTTWVPEDNWSPNRLDALVWAVTELAPWKKRSRGMAGADLTSDLGKPSLGY